MLSTKMNGVREAMDDANVGGDGYDDGRGYVGELQGEFKTPRFFAFSFSF